MLPYNSFPKTLLHQLDQYGGVRIPDVQLFALAISIRAAITTIDWHRAYARLMDAYKGTAVAPPHGVCVAGCAPRSDMKP